MDDLVKSRNQIVGDWQHFYVGKLCKDEEYAHVMYLNWMHFNTNIVYMHTCVTIWVSKTQTPTCATPLREMTLLSLRYTVCALSAQAGSFESKHVICLPTTCTSICFPIFNVNAKQILCSNAGIYIKENITLVFVSEKHPGLCCSTWRIDTSFWGFSLLFFAFFAAETIRTNYIF